MRSRSCRRLPINSASALAAGPQPRSANAVTPLCVHPAPRGHRRDRQPQVLAQGLARICHTEQAAALQLRHHAANEILVSSGNVGCGHDEAVASALDEPLLEVIANFFRTADDRIMHPDASAVMNELL